MTFADSRARFAGMVLLWLLSVALALGLGAASGFDWEIIQHLRLPRVILGTAVGMGLALSGVILQALFANPLCEPYTLGISSGAALGAVLGISFGSFLEWQGLSGTALVGAVVFTALLGLWSLRQTLSSVELLLAGVMLGFFGSSCVALWMAVADPQGVQNAIFWLLGDLSRARLESALVILGVAALVSGFVWVRFSTALDALLLGEEDAQGLGVPVRRYRVQLFLITSVLTGICVSAAGMVGFVGLVVPHVLRLRSGALHRTLIPMSIVGGASLVVFSDLLGRTVASPREIPVGVITALLGAPFFLRELMRSRGPRSRLGEIDG